MSSPAISSLPDRIRAELDALGRELGLVVADVLHRTGKSLIVAGAVGDQPVVAKLLLDNDEFWRAKFDHEIGVYRAFADHQPPIRVPSLIHTVDNRLLVLERLAGRSLDAERYPNHVLSEADVDAALDAVVALHTWQPPAGVFTPIFDYPERVDRYHGHGILTSADAEALRHLLDSRSGTWELNHGDPLPSNVFLTDDGDAALLDWEFTGVFLPGFDLAMLHTLLAGTPHALDRIERIVADRVIEVPFTINLAMVLTREIRTHRELPDGPLRDERLPLIETRWADARKRLHTLVRSGRR